MTTSSRSVLPGIAIEPCTRPTRQVASGSCGPALLVEVGRITGAVGPVAVAVPAGAVAARVAAMPIAARSRSGLYGARFVAKTGP